MDGRTSYPVLKTIKPHTQRVNFSLEQQLYHKVKKLKKLFFFFKESSPTVKETA